MGCRLDGGAGRNEIPLDRPVGVHRGETGPGADVDRAVRGDRGGAALHAPSGLGHPLQGAVRVDGIEEPSTVADVDRAIRCDGRGRGSRHEAGACRAARGAHHCPMEAALHDDRRRERPRRGREIFLARLTLLQGREGDRIDPGATAADPLETTITSPNPGTVTITETSAAWNLRAARTCPTTGSRAGLQRRCSGCGWRQYRLSGSSRFARSPCWSRRRTPQGCWRSCPRRRGHRP